MFLWEIASHRHEFSHVTRNVLKLNNSVYIYFFFCFVVKEKNDRS